MEETPDTIAYCHSCGAAMDVSKVAPFSNVECPACGKHTRVKREFGPYTLTRRLAIGGMSMVYLAQDNTLGREVAVKILSEAFSADEKRIAAFEDEAMLTASLSHPNIVRVYTTGKAFHRFYIAMELLPGGHFEQRIHEQGAIPEEELLPVAIEVAEGLKAAHSARLIHRDVKPGNILLDSEGHAKLVDFGLALVTHGGSAKASELWATPYYVPPETIEGAAEDFRSDIYAFGATLYHALTGTPSCAEETMATDLLRAAKKKVIPLTDSPHASSEEIREIIDKAMAYDPADRYQDYDALLSDLRAADAQLRAGNTVRLSRAAMRRQLKNQHRRSRILNYVMASIALTMLLAIGYFALRKKPAPPLVVAPPDAETAPAAPDDSAEMAKLYREAREALTNRAYPDAAKKFHALFKSERIHEPTRTWAGVESTIANYLQGDSHAAGQMASETLQHMHALQTKPPMSREIGHLLARLQKREILTAPDKNDAAPTLVSHLLAALKNWEMGMIEPATQSFRKATQVKLPGQSQWAAVYQNIAQDYLHDAALLADPVFRALPTEVASCEKALHKLSEFDGKWKTNGRAKFNAQVWKTDLERHRKLLAAKPVTEPAIPPVDPVPAAWGMIRSFQFAEAAKSLAQSPAAPASSLRTLCEQATAFLTDLENDLPSPAPLTSFTLKSGETVKNILVLSPGKLQFLLSNDTSRVGTWTDISPSSFVELHRTLLFSSSASTSKIIRHERAISFDWLVGDRDRATEAAVNLSSTQPDFKDRWAKIMESVPQ